MTLIIFILIFGVIVLIHEFGHFIFAKKAGVYIYEFSIGFGPKLCSFKRKNDVTQYSIRLIPLGGYVSMAGEGEGEDDGIPEDQRLCNKSFFKRFMVMVAGVMNNFLLGFIILFIMGLIYGTTHTSNVLNGIPKDGSLYLAGARDGDVVTRINGSSVSNYDDIQTYLALVKEGEKVDITIKNKDSENTYNIKPTKAEDGKYYYGISVKVEKEKGFVAALKYAKEKFISIFKTMFVVLKSLFTGKLGLDSLSGPVGIYNVVDQVRSSFQTILYLTAYLSINIGFMNILPFPAFDGGRVLFLIIEKIKGSKLNPKVESTVNMIGFMLLILLMVVITVKDVVHLF